MEPINKVHKNKSTYYKESGGGGGVRTGIFNSDTCTACDYVQDVNILVSACVEFLDSSPTSGLLA